MTDRDLFKQALEALESRGASRELHHHAITNLRERLAQPEHDWEAAYTKQVELHNQTLDELRDALAQPEQCQCPACRVIPHASDCAVHNAPAYPNGACTCGAQPEQELVCVCGAIWDGQELVSTPPQRKPLTHPQIHELDWPDGVSFEDILLFVRAIEAAHGIKEEA